MKQCKEFIHQEFIAIHQELNYEYKKIKLFIKNLLAEHK